GQQSAQSRSLGRGALGRAELGRNDGGLLLCRRRSRRRPQGVFRARLAPSAVQHCEGSLCLSEHLWLELLWLSRRARPSPRYGSVRVPRQPPPQPPPSELPRLRAPSPIRLGASNRISGTSKPSA